MFRILIVAIITALFLFGCSTEHKTHEWHYIGESVSQRIERIGLFSSYAVITTTEAEVISHDACFSPFMKGKPVYIRDDKKYLKIGDETIYLWHQ